MKEEANVGKIRCEYEVLGCEFKDATMTNAKTGRVRQSCKLVISCLPVGGIVPTSITVWQPEGSKATNCQTDLVRGDKIVAFITAVSDAGFGALTIVTASHLERL